MKNSFPPRSMAVDLSAPSRSAVETAAWLARREIKTSKSVREV